jgi:hypothetical protein
MSYFDSSTLTKRLQDKAIADGYITRLQQKHQPGYGPLLGVSSDSIINNIKMGQMQSITKNEGCIKAEQGCPCPPPVPVTPEVLY